MSLIILGIIGIVIALAVLWNVFRVRKIEEDGDE